MFDDVFDNYSKKNKTAGAGSSPLDTTKKQTSSNSFDDVFDIYTAKTSQTTPTQTTTPQPEKTGMDLFTPGSAVADIQVKDAADLIISPEKQE